MEAIIPYNSNKSSVNKLVQWDKDVHLYFYDKVFQEEHTVHLFTNNMNESMVIKATVDSNGVLCAKLPDDLLCYMAGISSISFKY